MTVFSSFRSNKPFKDDIPHSSICTFINDPQRTTVKVRFNKVNVVWWGWWIFSKIFQTKVVSATHKFRQVVKPKMECGLAKPQSGVYRGEAK